MLSGRTVARRVLAALVLAVALHAPALHAPAGAQQARVSDDAELRRTAEALIVWALMGVDQARKTGNVAVLRGLGTPAYRRRVSAAQVRAMLGRIKADDFATLHAAFKRFPQRLSFSRLQPRGPNGLAVEACWCPEGYHLYFDMRFSRQGRVWRIDAMKVWDAVD